MATSFRTLFPKAAYASLLALAINVSAHGAPLNLQDVPLFLTASVDPNVLINMSVETPMGGAAYTDNTGIPAGCGGRVTVGSNTDIGTCYFPTTEYLGYFDPNKCYTYSSNKFIPAGATGANHTCTTKWSGNFLNWVSMTAIDMFILNMTGGNRTTDSTTETVIRRARKTDNNSWFPRKALNAGVNVAPSTVTPYSDATLYFHNTTWGFDVGTSFNRATSNGQTPDRGQYTTAVRVCSSAAGLESNCVAYGNSPTYYKPEGLIQKNANSKRFGVLSYTLDNTDSRDGGVLRSKMKYVGPTLPDGTTNAAAEYETTGLLRTNPDGAAGLNSGVINYINKFSDAGYKSFDPIGELFYEGVRYFKNLGPTPEYSSGITTAQYGGFAIVTNWDDPIAHRCQKNFTVAINDANPWYDKTLPGTSFTNANLIGAAGVSYALGGQDFGEPSNPDSDINVTTLTNRVGELEGLNGTTWSNNGTWQVTDAGGNVTASGQNDSVGGGAGTFDNSVSNKVVARLGEVMGTSPAIQKQNSYYIAGLAYYANTTDLRTETDMDNDRGIQTVQSFVIDTQEYNANPLDGPKNMLWLAGKYGGFVDANGDGIPQTDEWDADQDGLPDNYVLATNPVNLTAGLNRAFSFIDDQTASASSASVNSGSISSETRVYQAKFDADDWTGQLLSFEVGSDGSLGGSVQCDSDPCWDAANEIPPAASRKIITRNSDGTAVAFQWSSLDSARKLQIDPTYVSNNTLGTALVNYLRGDASNEKPAGLNFRARPVSKLGDIVSSAPIFVGEPRFSYRDNLEDKPYSAFRLAHSDTDGEGADAGRTQVVYAGANDGMLHAFNAETGAELLGFIPGSVFANLRTLADVNYSHKFFVDGPPNMGDVFINNEWQTVLIGGLNKGGQAIYALNITNPSNFSEANADDIVLWEFTDSDADGATGGITGDADLGYTYSQPAIVRLQNGKWGAVFGNGYNNTVAVGAQSTTGHGVLYIVDIENGQLIRKIDTKVGSPTTPNGLSTPAAVDLNGDAIIDYIYAGDLRGNMWKFDVRDDDPDNWEVAYGDSTTPLPLFTATSQPITSRPEVIRGPRGVGMMVLFGTGKYLETTDKIIPVTPEIQAYYGLHDQNTNVDATDRITALTNLAQQSILLEKTVVFDTPSGDLTYNIRETSKVGTGGTGKGWYLNLRSPDAPNGKGYQGERQVSNSIVRAGRVIFTTLIPDSDPCNFGGNSWLMELDALSGNQLADTPFDLNRDGVFDENDYVTGADGTRIPISGLQPDVGITPEPGVLIGEGGTKEFKYNPGTTGTISVTVENPGEGASGRQSWRQIR